MIKYFGHEVVNLCLINIPCMQKLDTRDPCCDLCENRTTVE